jgi:mannose-6-phosphate isomerase-like protein (cupin superfamily)
MRLLFAALIFITSSTYADNKPQREDLLKGNVHGLDSHFVLTERLSVPANFTAPYHHHPVEEFLYILEGNAIVRFKDGEDVPLEAGDLYVIPAERIHTAVTGDTPTKALIFRVQPQGKPVAVPFKE